MGNLLGAPITEKETHTGITKDGLDYGVSSMQGWRIHMEDAHILQPFLYAEEKIAPKENADGGAANTEENGHANPPSSKSKYERIDLPDHSLYAVFDGHGGTFAAEYSGLNLCRVLSRQPKFVLYAKHVKEQAKLEETSTAPIDPAVLATSNRKGMELLEAALRDAFIDLDKEILREVQNIGNEDANMSFGENDEADTSDPASSGHKNKSHPEPSDDEDSGTTAVVVMVTPQWIVCANAGDSRAVYSKDGNRAIPLSYDHKPDDEEEERRIKEAGGYVAGGRVEGDLAVSRGLGDFRFKNGDTVLGGAAGARGNATNNKANTNMLYPDDQKVSPVPDIIVQNRSREKDEFIIVACDGIWDVQTNYECTKMVADIFAEGESDLGLICEECLDICLRRGSKDNMTTLVVKFPAQSIGNGRGVMARREARERAAKEEGHNEGRNSSEGMIS
mmetsp:Transcript_28964/g.42068  ORF Transcript_28964/g.42068 Transcript_28964/m.42068 type:complete len:448 (-) Transcript_28964:336-1679(-)